MVNFNELINKRIEKDDASVIFTLKNDLSDINKKNIVNIINEYYNKDDCDYIKKINDLEYKGDMTIISVFASDVGFLLKEKNLLNKIDSIYANDPKTNEISDILEFVKYGK